MKIALLGSAPSSLTLAPIGDPAWKVWGCSPGVYYQCGSPCAWFELHRWEPPIIGVPSKQKTWFSPEYVAWMALRDPEKCPVWMYDAVPQIPASRALPVGDLVRKYGSFFFTSTLAWMLACAIEDILEERTAWEKENPNAGDCPLEAEIGMWGVDMATNDEYGYQRAGCQHFLLIAADLGITITVPPESDLLRPMPLYGICESSHWMIKYTVRKGEHRQRIAATQQQLEVAKRNIAFLEGALDEINYQIQTWGEDRVGMGVDPQIIAQMPRVRAAALQRHIQKDPTSPEVPVGVASTQKKAKRKR